MEAKVYYQDFTLNATILTDYDIVFKPKEAVLMGKMYKLEEPINPLDKNSEGKIVTDKHQIANFIFYSFNVGQGKYQITKELAEKAGHTSMSVGDYVEFEDGDILICSPLGWKEIQAWNIYGLYIGEEYTEKSKKATEAITEVLRKLVNSFKMGDMGHAFISDDEILFAAEKIRMLDIVEVGVTDTQSREQITNQLEKRCGEATLGNSGCTLLTKKDVQYIIERFWGYL